MKKTKILTVQDSEITLVSHKEQEYISLTDMAKKFGSLSLIEQWLRNKNTLDLLHDSISGASSLSFAVLEFLCTIVYTSNSPFLIPRICTQL